MHVTGSQTFAGAQVDQSTGEIAGVFESIQPSDTDLGAKAPKDVKITGTPAACVHVFCSVCARC